MADHLDFVKFHHAQLCVSGTPRCVRRVFSVVGEEWGARWVGQFDLGTSHGGLTANVQLDAG